MNQLATYQQSDLPVRPTDLAKFILIAPEKVKVMQAEIRAIQKAQLAKEVYDQKKAELDRLDVAGLPEDGGDHSGDTERH